MVDASRETTVSRRRLVGAVDEGAKERVGLRPGYAISK
jgi:hypothetical protein